MLEQVKFELEGFEGERFVSAPRWVLQNIFRKGGDRLSKRKILEVVEAEEDWSSKWKPKEFSASTPAGFVSHGGVLVPIGTVITRKRFEQRGNLTEDEYAFYTGSPDKNEKWARCRYCLGIYGYKYEREQHLKKGLIPDSRDFQKGLSCAKRLQIGYKVLLRKGRCVICHVVQPRQRWGIPLCRGRCEMRWRYFRMVEPDMWDRTFGHSSWRTELRRPSSNRGLCEVDTWSCE